MDNEESTPEDSDSNPDQYTEDPTRTDTSSPNTIVKLDSHLETYPDSRRQPPKITADRLSPAADYAMKQNLDWLAAELHILMRQFRNYDEFVPQYTSKVLTEFTIECVRARERAMHDDDYPMETITEITGIFSDIGKWIDESHDAPIVDDVKEREYKEFLVPVGQGEYLDPVCSLRGIQRVRLISAIGE